MKYEKLHEWNVSVEEAIKIQNQLRSKIKLMPLKEEKIRYVAGVDLSFPEPNLGYAVIVVIDLFNMSIVENVAAKEKVVFDYIPGLLAFREGPVFLKAWENLKTKPNLVVFDGHGIAHPRGLGIASHMGLWINLPTIGVAKSKLYGFYKGLQQAKWSEVPLLDPSGNQIGIVIRTKENADPIFVSPGHLCDLDSASKIVKKMCLENNRLPEPTRLAHLLTQKIHRR
ncbi:endonuclease V [Pseudothermotoga thermarum]|uniref:Endonuclease V n=1 Tax=Pseudothermotoga thermarum DSM 5069 TaxID=688269 RepID=F7YX57_9THEM|nr:endonuclease V [Pseudothermotoga thermarum]AEH50955.1 Endonuclease V [Pseudothermotoga thermarum DSM 5069]